MNFKDYIPAKEAAEAVGISYQLFMSRCYKGKIECEKHGYAVFVHKDEVEREAKAQQERESRKG